MTTAEREPTIDLDLLAPTTRDAANDAYRAALAQCPVGWMPESGGHWVVMGYDEAADAFRDWETFSNRRVDPEISEISVMRSRVPLMSPSELDPPDFLPVRRVVAVQMSPDAAERLRPRARHWARHWVDRVIEAGRCEFVTDVVLGVPAAVTLEWLGFPESDWARMSNAFHDVSAHPHGSREHQAALTVFPGIAARVAEIVADRMASPRDDAISRIVHSEMDGEPMTPELARSIVFVLVGGGVDTTTSLTSAALLHLHRNPDDRARLLAEPELLDLATEEFLRFYPPARTHARVATRDVELGGCAIRAGDHVVISEAASARDPNAFPDPDTFVIDRFPNRHLSFGAGIHRCPGSHIARVMFTEVIGEILDRMPDYTIDDDAVVEYPTWAMMGGWARLPATFTPGPRLV